MTRSLPRSIGHVLRASPRRPGPDGSVVADERGASEVVGVALLIGIVILGVTAILMIGSTQLDQARESVENGQAEQALVQFDSRAARVATGGSTAQRVDLGLRANEGTLDVENDAGRVTVAYVNATTGASTELMNASLGRVVYENGDTSVAYQGGGVWRSDGTGSTMVSPPEIVYRGETLTMPVVRTTGGSVYSEVQVVRTESRQRFPNATADLTNRLTAGKLVITVRSRYYRAWGRYFEEEVGTVVRYDDARREVTVVFFGFPSNAAPDAGVIATSGPGRILLDGTGAYIDSYNSSQGPYASSQFGGGLVEAAGDVVTTGNSEIAGDVRAGDDVDVGGSSTVDGNVSAKGNITTGNGGGGGQITGTTDENGSYVISEPPIDQLVNETQASVRNRNDNDQTPVVAGGELQVTAQNDTLGPGRYYLENFDLQTGETLELNATGGDVTIVVRDWVRLQDGSEIEVRGNGTVQVFVASEDEIDESIPGGGQVPAAFQDGVHFVAKYGATVDVPGDDASRFQVYAPRHFEGAVSGSQGNANVPHVTATIVAPAGETGPGQFYVHQGHLYGGVVTGNLTLGQYGQVHFDHALLDAELLLGEGFARLDYLYVTEYEVEVERS